MSDENFQLEIIEKNIAKLNAPPNADKLSESFTFLGIELTSEQKNILKERNRFLHGSFLKTIDDDKAFREALHCSLRLHFMIAILILATVIYGAFALHPIVGIIAILGLIYKGYTSGGFEVSDFLLLGAGVGFIGYKGTSNRSSTVNPDREYPDERG